MAGDGEGRINFFFEFKRKSKRGTYRRVQNWRLITVQILSNKRNTCLNPFLSFSQFLTLDSFVHHNIHTMQHKKNLRNTSQIFSFFFFNSSFYFFAQIIFWMKYTDHPWGFMLIHKVPLSFEKLQWHPWCLHLIYMPHWRLRNYTDYSWDSGLIHKAPLRWSVYFRGALCINLKSQGWSVYFKKNLL